MKFSTPITKPVWMLCKNVNRINKNRNYIQVFRTCNPIQQKIWSFVIFRCVVVNSPVRVCRHNQALKQDLFLLLFFTRKWTTAWLDINLNRGVEEMMNFLTRLNVQERFSKNSTCSRVHVLNAHCARSEVICLEKEVKTINLRKKHPFIIKLWSLTHTGH